MSYKKAAAIVMSAVMLAAVFPAGLAEHTGTAVEVEAADHGELVEFGTEGDFDYIEYSDGTIEISYYNGNATELVIPARVNGKQVTSVDIDMEDKGRISRVVIPEGVKEIGSACFNGFSGLENIVLPSTLTEIGEWAFGGCTSLTTFRIPDSVTMLGHGVFDGCLKLETINIPAGVTELSSYQFKGCSFRSITVPETVKRIGEGAFYECAALKSVTISDGVEEIGEVAFWGTGISSLTVPGSVKRIGHGAFSECRALETLTLASGVERIEDAAFGACSALKNVTIPGSVESIGENSFVECRALLNVTVQEGVKTIGSWAFSYCTSLVSISIPNSVSMMGYDILSGSSGNMVCNANSYAYEYAIRHGYIKVGQQPPIQRPVVTPPTVTPVAPFAKGQKVNVSGGNYVSLGDGKAAYASPANKKAASATVADYIKVSGATYKVTQINAKAFSGCSKMKKITIKAKSLKKVGAKAFKGIHKKAKIKVPKAKLKAYKKLLKGKGQAKSVKITK